MKKFKPIFKQFGSSAILVVWPQEISESILADIHLFQYKIKRYKLNYLVELNAVYSSLLIICNENYFSFSKIKTELELIYYENCELLKFEKTQWEIPVCYDLGFGIDLEFIASENKIAIKEIIKKHSKTIYTVYGIGFLPGFLYLGGLEKELIIPRKNIPRLFVEKGSVGIGGSQTGIYPQDSPGGWNIIGKTPLILFSPKNEIPCLIKSGDQVKFKAISKNEFFELKEQPISIMNKIKNLD